MARIPTPIPKSLARRWRSFKGNSLGDMLWKLFLIVFGGSMVLAALASNSLLAPTIAGIVLFVFISDQVQEFAKDIWHRNFWVWRT